MNSFLRVIIFTETFGLDSMIMVLELEALALKCYLQQNSSLRKKQIMFPPVLSVDCSAGGKLIEKRSGE